VAMPFFVNAQVIIKEKVEINPVARYIPNSAAYSFDSTICNQITKETIKRVTTGDDKTYSVWYGDCENQSLAGYLDCFNFEIVSDTPWTVTIEEGFEYVQPRIVYLYCDGYNFPYYDEDDNFVFDNNHCLHLVFDKQKPDSIVQVKIKFSYHEGTANYTFNVYKPFFHLTPVDSFQVMEYGDYVIVDNFEVSNQCESFWPHLPDSVLIIKEIVQGNEYGQLWNAFTNEYGSSFTGRDIYLVANGVKPAQNAEIIVRIRTTDPEIEPLNLVYAIRPVDLEITVVPPTIAPGDTANIIIQKKYIDGTITNFNNWQTFEVAKLEGCTLGDILVNGESGAYFSDVYQPIQFVADSLAVNGTVKLKIGVPKYPSFACSVIGLDDTYLTQREHSQTNTKNTYNENSLSENQINSPLEGPPLPCSIEQVESVLNGDANVVVGNECDFENCGWNYDGINIQLVRQFNNFEEAPNQYAKVCETQNDPLDPETEHIAQSRPLDYFRLRKTETNEWKNSWNVKPCLNNENNIQFSIYIVDPNNSNEILPATIYIDFINDICYNFINPNPGDNNLLLTHTELGGISNPKQVMSDLCGHYKYPQRLSENAKIIKSVIEIHESIHQNNYMKILNERKLNFLIPKLNELVYSRPNYKMLFPKTEDLEIEVYSRIRQFLLLAKDDYERESYRGDYYDKEKNLKHEKDIQCTDSIKNIIKEYTFWLNQYQDTPIPTNCNTCK
jgi:hypothetical protein